MKTIGITGGVGSGKSAILGHLAEHYPCRVLYADELTAEMQKKGGKCYEPMARMFGPEYLLPDGELDRAKIGGRVFGDPEALKALNDLIHPIVVEEIKRQIKEAGSKENTEFFFLEAALLIETGFDKICDELWYIYARREVRIKRLEESRGYTPERSAQMMERQLSEEVFRKYCQVVIDNSGTLEESISQIRGILEG